MLPRNDKKFNSDTTTTKEPSSLPTSLTISTRSKKVKKIKWKE